MKPYFDHHMHFTGCLPLDYVWEKMSASLIELSQLKDGWQYVFDDKNWEESLLGTQKGFSYFQDCVGSYFTENNYKRNLRKFFKLYEFFQTVTKPGPSENSYDFYKEGTYRIAKSNFSEGIHTFEILAGPRLDPDITKERISAMVEGLKLCQKETDEQLSAKIRLTFIRDSVDTYLNLTPQSLEDLFLLLEENGMFKYISGFDFSGYENPHASSEMFDTISVIDKYRTEKGLEMAISLHAGEDFTNWSAEDHLGFFDKLSQLPVDIIGHGTFLWLPEKYLATTQQQEHKRSDLLEKFVSKEVVFEICPTANRFLTPLADYGDIPIAKFESAGLKYRICTDNKTIFHTDLKKEHYRLNLPNYRM